MEKKIKCYPNTTYFLGCFIFFCTKLCQLKFLNLENKMFKKILSENTLNHHIVLHNRCQPKKKF